MFALPWVLPRLVSEEEGPVYSSIQARVVSANQAPRRVMRGPSYDEEPVIPNRAARGTVLLLNGETELAVEKLRADAESGSAIALSDLAAALVTQSETGGTEGFPQNVAATLEAIVTARKAIAAIPTLAAPHFNLAMALEQAGFTPEAGVEFETAARLERDHRWKEEALRRAAWMRGAISHFSAAERHVAATLTPASQAALGAYLDERQRGRDVSRSNGVDAKERLARSAELYRGLTAGQSNVRDLAARLLIRMTQELSPREDVDPYAQRYFVAGVLHEQSRDGEALPLLRSLDGDAFAAHGEAGWAAQIACEQAIGHVLRDSPGDALDLLERGFDQNVRANNRKLALMFDDLARDVRAHLMRTAFLRRDTAGAFALADPRSTLEEIQNALALDAAVVEFSGFHRQVIAFVIRSESIEVVTLGLDAENVSRAAKAMRDADDAEFAPAAAALHAVVFAPILDRLEGISSLAIVPHRELMGIPFGALLDVDRGQYLGERFSIVHAPDALTAISASRRAMMDVRDPTLLAIAATEFDRDRYSGVEALLAADDEAAVIAMMSRCARVYAGADATPDAIVREIAQNAVIHYAGHIVRRGADVRLLLAPSIQGDSLSALEVGNLRLEKPRVVVLAACRGASTGELHAAMPNMAEAFLGAGVPTVIASSYDVDDGESPATMRRLHTFLRDGDDAADALRKTIIEELKIGRGHPLSLRFLAIGGSASLVR